MCMSVYVCVSVCDIYEKSENIWWILTSPHDVKGLFENKPQCEDKSSI